MSNNDPLSQTRSTKRLCLRQFLSQWKWIREIIGLLTWDTDNWMCYSASIILVASRWWRQIKSIAGLQGVMQSRCLVKQLPIELCKLLETCWLCRAIQEQCLVICAVWSQLTLTTNTELLVWWDLALPIDIKCCGNLSAFRKALKTHICKAYYCRLFKYSMTFLILFLIFHLILFLHICIDCIYLYMPSFSTCFTCK